MNAPSPARTVLIISRSTDPPFAGLDEKVANAYPDSVVHVVSPEEAGAFVYDLMASDRLVLCHDAGRCDLRDLVSLLRTRRLATPTMVLTSLEGDAERKDLSRDLALPCLRFNCTSVELATAFVSVYEPRSAVSGLPALTVDEPLFILINPILRISQFSEELAGLLGMSPTALLGSTVSTFVCEEGVALFTTLPGMHREGAFLTDLVGADGTHSHVLVRRKEVFREALFLGFLYTFFDLSDYPRLQERDARDVRNVAAAKRDLEMTLDAIMDPIVVTDQHARVRRVNRAFAQRLGKPFSKIIGHPCGALLAPEGPAATVLASLHSSITVPAHADELTLQPLKGTFNVDCFPSFTPEGILDGWVHLMHPPGRRLGLLDDRAHDLRNSLTALSGFAGLLLEREDVPDAIKAELAKIALEAERSVGLARSLLSEEG